MTEPISIRYQSATFPVAIDGPCPECGQPLEPGDSITIGPPVRHRACDPTAILLDDLIARDLDTYSRDARQRRLRSGDAT